MAASTRRLRLYEPRVYQEKRTGVHRKDCPTHSLLLGAIPGRSAPDAAGINWNLAIAFIHALGRFARCRQEVLISSRSKARS
jgi:hypothetical protein